LAGSVPHHFFAKVLIFDCTHNVLYDMSNAIDMGRRRIMSSVVMVIVRTLNGNMSIRNQIEIGLWSHMCSEMSKKETLTTSGFIFNQRKCNGKDIVVAVLCNNHKKSILVFVV